LSWTPMASTNNVRHTNLSWITMTFTNTTLDYNKFALDPYSIYKHNVRLEQVCLGPLWRLQTQCCIWKISWTQIGIKKTPIFDAL